MLSLVSAYPSLSYGDNFLEALLSAKVSAENNAKYFLTQIKRAKKEISKIHEREDHDPVNQLLLVIKDPHNKDPINKSYIIHQSSLSESVQTELFWRTTTDVIQKISVKYINFLEKFPQEKDLWKRQSIQMSLRNLLIQLNRSTYFTFNSFTDIFDYFFKNYHKSGQEGTINFPLNKKEYLEVVTVFRDASNRVLNHPTENSYILDISDEFVDRVRNVLNGSDVFHTHFMDYFTMVMFYKKISELYVASEPILAQTRPSDLTDSSKWVDVIYNVVDGKRDPYMRVLEQKLDPLSSEAAQNLMQSLSEKFSEEMQSIIRVDVDSMGKRKLKQVKKRAQKLRKQKQLKESEEGTTQEAKRPEATEDIYSGTLKAYRVAETPSRIIELISKMKEEGISVSAASYNELIRFYADKRDPVSAELQLRRMKEEKISPDLHSYNLLIQAFAREGKISQARDLLYQMKVVSGLTPELWTYKKILHAYCREGKFQKAQGLFKSMKEDGIEPDLEAYHILMNGYATAGKWNQVKEMLDQLKTSGFNLESKDAYLLLKAYGVAGQVKLAEAFIADLELKNPDPLALSHVINAYLNAKEEQKAVTYFRSFNGTVFSPNVFTSSVLNLHCDRFYTRPVFDHEVKVGKIDLNHISGVPKILAKIALLARAESKFPTSIIVGKHGHGVLDRLVEEVLTQLGLDWDRSRWKGEYYNILDPKENKIWQPWRK